MSKQNFVYTQCIQESTESKYLIGVVITANVESLAVYCHISLFLKLLSVENNNFSFHLEFLLLDGYFFKAV